MATSVTLKPNAIDISGSTSGTTTLQASAVAGTTTLTLPAATDTLVGKATTDTLTNKTLTGAAMNGTLGATTPSTASVTTLTTSSTVTHSGGTANGVAYLDGSKVLTTGSALTFNGSTLAVTGALSATTSITSTGSVGNVSTDSTGARLNFSRGADNYFQASSAGGYFVWIVNGSGSNAMTLDASGNLALGTTSSLSPSSGRIDLTINGTSSAMTSFGTGNTRRGYFLHDATDLTIASETAGSLRFLNNGSERARIDSSGNLLVGATSGSGLGSSKIYVLTNNQNGIISQQSVTGAYCYLSNALTNGGTFYHFQFNENGTQRGSITSNGTATTYGTSSDYRLKENIAPMTGALDIVAQLKPVTYKWKSNGSAGQGFIAHELQAIVPDAVVGEKDAVNEDGSIKPQGIDTSFLVATLTAAIKEQQAIIQSLTARITALESA